MPNNAASGIQLAEVSYLLNSTALRLSMDLVVPIIYHGIVTCTGSGGCYRVEKFIADEREFIGTTGMRRVSC